MGGIPGVVGAIGGLLACIASSMLMCCAPKKVEEGPCKFTAAGVMLLIAGILQLIMTVVVIVFMIMVLTEVNDDGYCADRYKSCNADSNGCSCTDGTSGWPEDADGITSYEYYCSASTDGLCFDNSVDSPGDTSTMCAPTEELGLGLGGGAGIARHRSTVERVPTAIHPPSVNGHPQLTGALGATRKNFASRSTARPRMLSRSVALASRAPYTMRASPHPLCRLFSFSLQAIVVILFGIAAAFLLIAGIPNTIQPAPAL